ncbi:V-type ATP synthase subunit E [Salinispira pacifica]
MPHIIGDLDRLLTGVQHTVHDEVQRIKEDAEKEAYQIRVEAEKSAEASREDALRSARAEAESIRRRKSARATQEERRNYVETREKLLDQVFGDAEERLRASVDNDDEYADALKRLTMWAVSIMGPGSRVLQADERGQKLLTDSRLSQWAKEAGSIVAGEVTLEKGEEALSTWGGILVADKGGRRTVDATFPARLRLAREEIRETIVQRLVES